jgi:hypothetical protein
MTRSIRSPIVLSALALILAGIAFSLPAKSGAPVQRHLDLATPGPRLPGGIPADCSTWHELYPAFCALHHQDSFEDNGDGLLSPCDFIELSGIRYHIVWVGPTYFLQNLGDGGLATFEPTTPQPGNPTCQIWHDIGPSSFCQERHVDNWDDSDQSGDVSACDVVILNGKPYHVERVGLNIIIEPADPTSVEQNTWGRIKSLFRGD